MSDDLPSALTEAVRAALREMAAVECAAGEHAPPMELSAVLPVTTAAGVGLVTLSMPETTALALARRILAHAGTSIEPDAAVARDCAGEVVNVVCGQAKTLLRGTPHHFILGTPHVEDGARAVAGALVIAFDSEAGPFVLRAQLPV